MRNADLMAKAIPDIELILSQYLEPGPAMVTASSPPSSSG
jgi:hypothetical protein